MINKIKNYINEIEEEIIEIRKYLHKNPEVGFDLDNTYKFVFNKLKTYGYTPKKCGKMGIIADVGKGMNAILLRAEMDALEIEENTNLEYKSTNMCMHACGHDMHMSMLLGAAKVLKHIERNINGSVRLMFQPAEEILEGCKDMINNGLLDNINIKAAIMVHTFSATNLKTSSILIAPKGICAPSCDNFKIEVIGKNTHAAYIDLAKDPIYPLTLILQAIYMISKEINIFDKAIINITSFNSNNHINITSDKAYILGTIRCFSEEIRNYIKIRINEIVKNISNAFNIESNINYLNNCPTFIVDNDLYDFSKTIIKEYLNNQYIEINSLNNKTTASEDFSYISHLLPTILISISAGSIEEGYINPLHNSKVEFNNEAIKTGILIYSLLAYKYFNN